MIEHRGARFINPTLVLKRGERVRIDFENSLQEPTIVHWHGLAVDTRNDGAAVPPVSPGGRYSYAFEVRDRGALYWYHPHPHGLTAGQAYRGLFGLIEVEDDDERALRAALELVPGKSEIPLILQDRRGAGTPPPNPIAFTDGSVTRSMSTALSARISRWPAASIASRAQCVQRTHLSAGAPRSQR
jgi:FtsP/CotA-like multicopper oxidase with cupredoxin domain